MSDEKKHGPVRGLMKGLMETSAKAGWRVGMLSAAVDAIEKVADEARAQLKETPNHKLAREVEATLTRAAKDVEGLAARMADAACGED